LINFMVFSFLWDILVILSSLCEKHVKIINN
jgi:hypothetical protein